MGKKGRGRKKQRQQIEKETNIENTKIPLRREWQHTPIFLPGEFHGQRSLAGYSPWGSKESDTIERSTARMNKPFNLSCTHQYLYPLIASLEDGNEML